MAHDHGGNQPAAPTSTNPIATASPKKQEESPTPQIEHKIPVATHSGHHNKTPKDDFRRVEASQRWQNQELTALELIDWISSGKAWVACHLAGGTRKEESAGVSDLIVLDVDGDITLNDFWAIPSVSRHCLFTATSCSHTPEEHRFRAVFRCERHNDPRLHRAIYHQLLAALGLKLKDNSGEKPERLWFGNTAAAIEFGGGEPLSWELIENARDALKAAAQARAERSAQVSAGDQATANQRAAWVLEHLLAPSVDGEFQPYWSPVLNAAAATGDDAVREAFMVWHHKGHHSKTQSRVAKRLDKAGTRLTPGEGAGRILQFAKQQHGEQWWRRLPESLWYRNGGGGTKAPTVLLRARSADDIAPLDIAPLDIAAASEPQVNPEPPETGGSYSLFSAGPGATSASAVPDKVPSALELQRLATVAAAIDPPISTAARIRQLIELIYWLKVENTHRGPGNNAVLSEADAEDQIDEYTSELLAYPVFNRRPEKIDLKLLQLFREQHGVRRRSRRKIKAEHLFSGKDQDPDPLIGNLMAQGCSYILYARQGVGKSKLALLLSRAVLGTPGHSRFLDYKPVPPQCWGAQRVLYIASDGGEQAKSDLRRYAESMDMEGAQWLDYLDIVSASKENDAARWRIDLYELHLLAQMLDQAAANGTPYRLVVIDSLKATAPDGIRVGAQEIVDYVDLVDGICSPRSVAVLYIHHQAKEGDNAQGAAGLLEMVHGVFRLKQENGQHFFCVEKTRLDERGNREIPYQITGTGELRLAAHVADETEDDQGRELILRAFQEHYEKHVKRIAHLHKTDLSRGYSGIGKSDYLLILRSAGSNHNSWRNLRAVTDIINKMVKEGSLKRLKNKQIAVANAEAFTQVTTEQMQLHPAAIQQEEPDDEIAGW